MDWLALSDFLCAFSTVLKLRFGLVPQTVVAALAATPFEEPIDARHPLPGNGGRLSVATDDDMFPPLGTADFDAAVEEVIVSQAPQEEPPTPEEAAAAVGRACSIGRLVNDLEEAMKHFEHYQVLPRRLPNQPRTMTDEQRSVVDFDGLGPGKLLLVLAYAGTGKTTTLMEFAQKRPRNSFLYVAFNKDIATDSASKFPPNVRCRTMHSVALEFARQTYGTKIEHGEMQIEPVARMFECSRTVATYIIQTIQRFCWRIRGNFEEYDVPSKAEEHYKKKKLEENMSMSQRPAQGRRRAKDDWDQKIVCATKAEYVKFAERLWKRILDPADLDMKIAPEAYLKYAYSENFQLGNYDFIFFDEVQDASEVMIMTIKNQRRDLPDAPRKVVVGDVHQRIYGWRGAVTDLMQVLKPDAVLRLTTSFRFDIGIANIASSILADLKNEAAPLWGIRKPHGATLLYHSPPRVVPANQDSVGDAQGSQSAGPNNGPLSDPMDYEGSQSMLSQQLGVNLPQSSQAILGPQDLPPAKVTYICRTNHHVLLRAVRMAAQDRVSTLGCTISRANLQRMIRQLTDAHYLRKGRRHLMTGPMKQSYTTWADFEKDLEESTDPELHTIHEVTEDLKEEDAPRMLKTVETRMVENHMLADLVSLFLR